jgi:hypothetical protein
MVVFPFSSGHGLRGLPSNATASLQAPLTDDEAGALLKHFQSAPADQRTVILRGLTQGLESQHVKALAGQFVKQDAGMMA